MNKTVETSNNGVRLLIRPNANLNTNRQDYLMRIAQINGIGGIGELISLFKVSYLALASMNSESLNKLINGVPAHYLLTDAEVITRGSDLRRRGLAKASRVCPSCIAEERPQHVCFNFAVPVVCPSHGTLPIDFCPRCGVTLSYFRKSINHCDCGYYLGNASGIAPPEWLGKFHRIFTPWRRNGWDFYLRIRDVALLDWHASKNVFSNHVTHLGRKKRESYINSSHFPTIELILSRLGEFTYVPD